LGRLEIAEQDMPAEQDIPAKQAPRRLCADITITLPSCET
jgi:hypothetical protein